MKHLLSFALIAACVAGAQDIALPDSHTFSWYDAGGNPPKPLMICRTNDPKLGQDTITVSDCKLRDGASIEDFVNLELKLRNAQEEHEKQRIDELNDQIVKLKASNLRLRERLSYGP